MTTSIAVTLITDDARGRIQTVLIGRYPTRAQAFDAALLAAGGGAVFHRRGITLEYVGTNGVAHIGLDARLETSGGHDDES